DMSKAHQAGDKARYRARDGELHQAFIDLCGNPYISDAYKPVGFRIQALRSRLADESKLNRASFRDHGEMVKLVKAREVGALQSLLRTHIRQTMSSYLEVLGDRDALADAASPLDSNAVPVRRGRTRAARDGGGGKRAARALVRTPQA